MNNVYKRYASEEWVEEKLSNISQPDWNEEDSASTSFIKNKPDLDSHLNSKSNPHEVTKVQIGLSNVENKSSEIIRSEITKDDVTRALGYNLATVAITGSWNDLTDRTHWVEEEARTTIVDTFTCDFSSSSYVMLPGSLSLYAGYEKYILVVDGVEYFANNNTNSGGFLNLTFQGSRFSLYRNGIDSYALSTGLTGSYVVSIIGVKPGYHPLDEQYIPETIARKTDIENHTQSASSITEGIFDGIVQAKATSQPASYSVLRNSKLVPEETDPINNGEICWTYE